jgi:hypothetical protein
MHQALILTDILKITRLDMEPNELGMGPASLFV